MEITARVANLGKYAAGILADTELSFPTTTRRVQDALRKIGVDGLRYEEIIILDYTASVPLLSSRLGEYARIDELNYLACRLAGMSQEEKAKFSAALEHGDYGGDLSDIIDLTYRLDCYTLLPEIRNYEDYGYHLVESRRDFYLPQKARYYFDFSQYGEDTIINEGGTLTPQGYIRADRGKVFTQVYDGEHMAAYSARSLSADWGTEISVP